MATRGRPRKAVPPEALQIMNDLQQITSTIKKLQDEVVRLSQKRKELALKARDIGASTGWIAEACGLKRRSYPIRK